MTDSTTTAADTPIEESPFIEDQRSLQSPTGLIMTLGIVFIAATLCGAAIYIGLS